MAADVVELKHELAGIVARLADFRSQISVLEDQKAAFEKVIQFYDPEFKSSGSTTTPKPTRTSSWNSSSGRVTELLKGKNNRHIVLDILRRFEHPSSTSDIAKQFSLDEDLGEEAERLQAALTTRFSGTLDGLLKQGLVSQALTVDGGQNLWEVNRQSGGTPRTQT
ncbi:hypothetical protein [Agrobacterium burrii]|uniref:Uncharacterized protein n=1 Tax=Agrobacterium burrii TaxID=2815339 RepID=A0ABS3EG24_9HYPH|nr:hypothetical protein [Agrobacterium burrii]MBO0130915.1 hypothetical protein [Agrobacterium burrii]